MSAGRGRSLLRIGLMAVLILGVGFFVWARLLAGGPVSLIPGGVLSGEVVAEPVRDWDFVRTHQYLDLESRARLLPYSRGTWFMVHEGQLFVLLPRLFGTGLEERVTEDPNVRVRIDGRVYAGRVSEAGDSTQIAALLGPLLRRTMSVEVSGHARPVAGERALPHGGIGVYRFESAGLARQ
jgi:hypothetical protein